MKNFAKSFIPEVIILLSFFLGCGLTLVYAKHNHKVKEIIKEVEVDHSLIIEVPQKYNLTGAEYTKRIVNQVTVTSYNNHTNQTDDSPNITATNRPVRENMVAASFDLLNKGFVHYGDLVYIDCMKQWYVVEDTMNKRFERTLDIFLFSKEESLKINKKCNIEIVHISK